MVTNKYSYKGKAFFFLAVLLFITAAINPVYAQTEGTIAGTIFMSDGVTPITQFAWVDIQTSDFSNCCWHGDVDGNGNYSVNLPPGTYIMEASGDGWAKEFFDNAGQNGSFATHITVTAGQTTFIDFALEPQATISGTVLGSNGVPLAGIHVGVGDLWVAGACTDANGNFTITNLQPSGTYKLFAESASWCGGSMFYPQEWWPNSPNYEGATPVPFNSTGINFSLDLGGAISGRIFEADGVTPVNAHAWVNVSRMEDGQWVAYRDKNEDGTFSVAVPAGVYRVDAAGNNRELEYYNNAGQVGDYATPITVIAGVASSNVNFALSPAGIVSGQVRDEFGNPLANVNVGMADAWLGSCTDSNGYYQIYNVTVGRQYKIFAGGGDWCENGLNYVEEYWLNAANWDTATPLIVTTEGQELTNVDFSLAQSGKIWGVVTAAESGAPLANITVCAFNYNAPSFDVSGTWRCGGTQPDGTYEIAGVAPGAQRLWIFPEDRLRLFYPASTSFEGAQPVNVTGGQVTPNVNFSLPLASVITGHVYDVDGVSPLGGVTISTADGQYMECSQSDGSYRIFVPAGTYKVKAGTGVCYSGINFPTQYSPETASFDNAASIVVPAVGQTIPRINFTRTFTNMSFVANTSFETAGTTKAIAASWKPVNLLKDKRKCNNTTTVFSRSGNCAFFFKANTGTTSSITQTGTTTGVVAGDTLTLSAWVAGTNLSNGVRIQAKVIYANGTSDVISLDTVGLNNGTYNYSGFVASKTMAFAVNKVKVQIRMKNGTGKFMVDDIRVVKTNGVPRSIGRLPIRPVK